jgi:hypothetical protein
MASTVLTDCLEANTPIYRLMRPGLLKVSSELSIRQGLRDQNVLVTGATGFIGSLAAAQLLAGCPEVGTVWLLVPATQKATVQAQLAHLIEESVQSRGYVPPQYSLNLLLARCPTVWLLVLAMQKATVQAQLAHLTSLL